MKNVLNTWIIVIFLTSYTKNKDICNEVSGGDIGFKFMNSCLIQFFKRTHLLLIKIFF